MSSDQTPLRPVFGLVSSVVLYFKLQHLLVAGTPGLTAGNVVEWNTTIPLYVGQKIETIKPQLEQMTRKSIDLQFFLIQV